MPTVVGVRLRFSKTLWFDPAGAEPELGDIVIVATERGTEFGTVVQEPHDVAADALPAPLKPLLRVATEDDMAKAAELQEKEHTAMLSFRRLVEHYRLDMKPVAVEYLLDGDKIVFYFSADERVDFRELVKDLASEFHARIDMRQVGVRDEARSVGGIGHCGQRLCCVRFGGEFQPVSIRMAKEQDLPLNPLKISGLCGRLMCCLRYEYDAYKDFKSRAPKRGAIVDTPAGTAKVAELNTPRETVRMRLEDGTSVTVGLEDMECGTGGGCAFCVKKEAFEAFTQTSPVPVMPEPVAKPVAAPSEQESSQPPREGSGRKRRRRRSGGGSAAQEQGGGSEQKQTPKQPRQEPKAAESGQAASEAKPGRSTRRRRRRRSGGAGGNTSADSGGPSGG